MQPTRIEVEPQDSDEELPTPSAARPLTLAYERRMLAQADRDIAAAQARIDAQADRLATLARDGHEIGSGRRLLDVFKATLQAMVEHRQMIVEQIERLSQRETDPKTDA
ncbi:hypothetical protein BG58_17910 [Caballeronia jiangsuensis]|nr:hypothetical protein BG58_17910 [Caballeronia jiangsuensis]